MNDTGRIGYGPELYHQVQRLIHEWMGSDAGDRNSLLPPLVDEIVGLVRNHTETAMHAAAHDASEAA